MPLNRFQVTDFSRHLIPVIPAFSAGVGLSWIVTPEERLHHTPVFDFVLNIAPAWAWGLLYLITAITMFIAVLNESRATFVLGLRGFGYISLLFAGLNVLAFFSANAAFSSWMWPAFAAYVSRVVGMSLLNREAN